MPHFFPFFLHPKFVGQQQVIIIAKHPCCVSKCSEGREGHRKLTRSCVNGTMRTWTWTEDSRWIHFLLVVVLSVKAFFRRAKKLPFFCPGENAVFFARGKMGSKVVGIKKGRFLALKRENSCIREGEKVFSRRSKKTSVGRKVFSSLAQRLEIKINKKYWGSTLSVTNRSCSGVVTNSSQKFRATRAACVLVAWPYDMGR